MKRLIIALLIVVPLRILAANGDITGVAVRSDGWSADIYIYGLNTNGAYSYGLGSNNVLTGSENLRINVTSQGFNDTGSAITKPRTVVGTFRVRKPYPNNAAADETLDAGVLRVRVALSDYVYSGDSNLTASLDTGFYAEGGTNSAAASSITVTNASTVTYPNVIGNWSWPGWQHITNNTMTVRGVFFHRHAQDFRPVRVVKFTATDTSGNQVSNYVTRMTLDMLGEAISSGEYKSDLDVSTLTQGQVVRVDFAAYPWIGDSASVRDTGDNAFSQPTTSYASISNLLDRTLAYGRSFAVVDPTNGVDATGVAVTNWTATNPSPFLTIAGAATAIAATNNAKFSRNDVGASVIYLTNGTHAWLGGTATVGGIPKCWLTIEPLPGVLRAAVVIQGQSGSKDAGDRILVRNVTWDQRVNTAVDQVEALWQDQNDFNFSASIAASVLPIYRVSSHYITRSLFTSYGSILSEINGVNHGTALVRGNWMPWMTNQISASVMMGNWIYNTNARPVNSRLFLDKVVGVTSTPGASTNCVLYNNAILGWNSPNNQRPIDFDYTAEHASKDVAIVQNLVEKINTASYPNMLVSADGVTNTSHNVLVWHNSLSGDRINIAYNDLGTTAISKELYSIKGNRFEDANIKTDTFPTESGNRTGNWPALWGVGSWGNFNGAVTNIGAGGFSWEFWGIASTWKRTGGVNINLPTIMGFVDRKANSGTVVGPGVGFGNYRTISSAYDGFTTGLDVLPFDLDGNARSKLDIPGAYASGITPRSAGAFAQ